MATDRPVVNINGVDYTIGQLEVMEQWHVARRLSPILGELGGAFKRMAASHIFKDADPAPTKTVEQIQAEVAAEAEAAAAAAAAAEATADSVAVELEADDGDFYSDPKMLEMFDILAKPLSAAISQMSNQDSEYIIRTCLTAVKRKQKTGYSPVIEPRSGALRFQDINLRTMLTLTVRVIIENLGDFLPTSL